MRLRYLPFLVLIILLVSPVSAIPNIFNSSNAFDVWSGGSYTKTPNSTITYDGSNRGWKINETIDLGPVNHYLYTSGVISATVGTNYTLSVYAKEGSVRYLRMTVGTGSFGSNNGSNFDLNTCTITYSAPTVLPNVESAANGWCRLRVTGKAIAASTTTGAIFGIRSPGETTSPEYTGNINNYSYIFGAQMVIGDTVGTYNATNAYPESNFTASTYSGVSPQSVDLYDNTTPSEIVGWNWYAINQANSSPEYAIETTQNPTHIFGEGNWTVKLKASNYLYSGNSSSKWINISAGASTTTDQPGPTIFNWYCPAGRWCLGPFIIWDPSLLVTEAAT